MVKRILISFNCFSIVPLDPIFNNQLSHCAPLPSAYMKRYAFKTRSIVGVVGGWFFLVFVCFSEVHYLAAYLKISV